MFRHAPAEADMQRHFRVSPPSVHQMVLGLERDGLITRQPGVARSINILVPPQDLPILDWLTSTRQNLCDELLVGKLKETKQMGHVPSRRTRRLSRKWKRD